MRRGRGGGIPAWRVDLRRELLNAALERRTVTYGYLMRKFSLSRGARGRGSVVGAIGDVGRHEEQTGGPGFAAIVVRKDTGFPGGGFFCWDDIPVALRRPRGEASNPRLSEVERAYIKGLQEEIWNHYGRGLLDRRARTRTSLPRIERSTGLSKG